MNEVTPWQQIYCTHCTYRTSLLHQRHDDVAEQSFEYSVRAGSIPAETSHEVFRSLESAMYYDLPADTPADDLLTRTPTDTPPRLIVFPDLNGSSVLGQLRYRQMDTQGRPGSYFGHLLVNMPHGVPAADSRSSEPSRSLPAAKLPAPMARLLQFWGHSDWRAEDGEDIPFALPTVDSPDTWAGETQPLLHDALLHTFLTADEFDSRWFQVLPDVPFANAGLIPDRWRVDMTPDERQAWLLRVMDGLLHVSLAAVKSGANETPERGTSPATKTSNKPQQFVIAAEPGVNALLLYGAFRLLPSFDWLQSLSVSTLESHYTRPSTNIAGVSFCEPDLCELLPDTYSSRGLGLNTWSGKMSDVLETPASTFCRFLLDSFVATDVSLVASGYLVESLPLDGFRQQLATNGESSLAELNLAAEEERELQAYLNANGQSDLPAVFMKDARRRAAVGQRLEQRWSAAYHDGEDLIPLWANSPQAVTALELLDAALAGSAENIDHEPPVLHRFFTELPSAQTEAALASPQINKHWLARLLVIYFQSQRQLPPQGTPFVATREGGEDRSVVPFFCRTLAEELSPEEVQDLAKTIPRAARAVFARALLLVASKTPAKLPMIVELSQSLTGDELTQVLRERNSARFLLSACKKCGVNPRPIVGRVADLWQDLSADPRRFKTRLSGLLAMETWLPAEVQGEIRNWVVLQKEFAQLNDPPTHHDVQGILVQLPSVMPDLLERPLPPLSTLRQQLQAIVAAVAPANRQKNLWQALQPELLTLVLDSMDSEEFRAFLSQPKAMQSLGNLPTENSALTSKVQLVLDNLSSVEEPEHFQAVLQNLACIEQQITPDLAERLAAWKVVYATILELDTMYKDGRKRMFSPRESDKETSEPLERLGHTVGAALAKACPGNERLELAKKRDDLCLTLTGHDFFKTTRRLLKGFGKGIH